jgi:uncharacterized protein (TIGR03382 family)
MSHASLPCSGCGGVVEARRVLRVRSRSDLARLTRSWNRFDRVDLVTDRLDADERERWERRLLSAYTECGCDAGGLTVLVALAGLVVFAVAFPRERTWTDAGLGLAATLAAAVVGKVAGIAVARIRLRRDIRRVRSFLTA